MIYWIVFTSGKDAIVTALLISNWMFIIFIFCTHNIFLVFVTGYNSASRWGQSFTLVARGLL